MASQVQQIFSTLKCSIHNEAGIVQVCVSSACPQTNRLCCLECVDEYHMGHDHVLLSHQKFNKLVEEFHAVLNEKQSLNRQLFSNLKNHQLEVTSQVDNYYKYIEDSLVKQNELTSYEELNLINLKQIESQQLKKKLNEMVDNHSWMLELNAKSKTSQDENAVNIATSAIRQKYQKLQKRLQLINLNCQAEIKQAIDKQSTEVRKLFHLFDEIKYKIEDNGASLECSVPQSNSDLKNHEFSTPDISPHKETPDSAEEQKKNVKSIFSFLGNLVGGGS